MPGAHGIVALHPKSRDVAARLLFRATLPSNASKLVVRVSEDGYVAPGQTSLQLRVGVQTDSLEWLPDQTIGPHTTIAAESWSTLELPLTKWAGQDALIVLEFSVAGTETPKSDEVFVDEIAIR
jgi:hypothetical protein